MTDTSQAVAALAGYEQALIAAARAAASRGHGRYSGLRVGAAARLSDGSLRQAANFENASLGLSLCAETVLIALLNSEARLDAVEAIAVAAEGRFDTLAPGDFLMPCGRCRQVLAEAVRLRGGRDIPVLAVTLDGARLRRSSARALLPLAFGDGA